MNLMTKVTIPKSNALIDYNACILSLGSCFAENIGEKFQYFKFTIATNPFGIIFNPASIDRIIDRTVNQELFTEKDIFYHDGRWHCFEVHSELSNENQEAFLQQLNEILKTTATQISQSSHLIITLGTSWVYRNLDSGKIVANCHKVPQKQFTKELLSVESIKHSLENMMNLVTNINKNVKFIFTVSPVRHIKDGFVENTVSKSHLLSALFTTVQRQNINIAYFPSYEIMTDELRDYRFYSEDLLHPSPVAIQYIWERFKETNISPAIFSVMEEVANIQKALAHKPFHPNSESHLKFLENIKKKIDILAEQYPETFFDFHSVRLTK